MNLKTGIGTRLRRKNELSNLKISNDVRKFLDALPLQKLEKESIINEENIPPVSKNQVCTVQDVSDPSVNHQFIGNFELTDAEECRLMDCFSEESVIDSGHINNDNIDTMMNARMLTGCQVVEKNT